MTGRALAPTALHDLYPPHTPEHLRELIRALPTGDRDEQGRHILHRALTSIERGDLLARGKVLEHWLARGDLRKMKAAVSEMLLGFGSAAVSEDDANAICSQYVSAAREMPLFAFRRACTRFGAGEVKPEEIGEKHLSKSHRPTSAHICALAGKIAEPYVRERWRLGALLTGVVARQVSTKNEQERQEFIDQALADFAQKKSITAIDTAELEARKQGRARATMEGEVERRRREYRDAGLDPPSSPMPTSLPMMIKMGYRIEEVDGKRVLASSRGRVR